MPRVTITKDGPDGPVVLGWYDPDDNKTTVYPEGTEWDPQNQAQVSMITGDPALHEELTHTAGGAWVLHHWSTKGRASTRRFVPELVARDWLLINNYDNRDIRRAVGSPVPDEQEPPPPPIAP
jgi:hypothetical protein